MRWARILSKALRNFSTDFGLSGLARKIINASRASLTLLLRILIRGGPKISSSSPLFASIVSSKISSSHKWVGETSRDSSLDDASETSGLLSMCTTTGEGDSRVFLRRRRRPVSTLGSTKFKRLYIRVRLAVESDRVARVSITRVLCALDVEISGSTAHRALSARSKSFVRFLLFPRISSCFVLALRIEV